MENEGCHNQLDNTRELPWEKDRTRDKKDKHVINLSLKSEGCDENQCIKEGWETIQ